MAEQSRFRVLAGEHLPDGVASQVEFLEFFRHLLRASADEVDVKRTEVRVVSWLVASSVRHHIVVRDSDTGRMCCRFEIAIAMRISPAELDRHATDLARLLGEALNLNCCALPPLEPRDAQ